MSSRTKKKRGRNIRIKFSILYFIFLFCFVLYLIWLGTLESIQTHKYNQMPNESIVNSGEVVFLQASVDQKPSPTAPSSSNANFLTNIRSRLPSRSISPYAYRTRFDDRQTTSYSGDNNAIIRETARSELITRHQLQNVHQDQSRRGRSRSREKKKVDTKPHVISLMGFDTTTTSKKK